MNLNPLKLTAAMAGILTLTLAACGGGSSTSSAPEATPITISGTAATGAAFTDAVVYVYDSAGAVVGTSSAIGSDGQYSVTLNADAVAPFVLVASRMTADGLTESLVSVVSSTAQTTANVTPITSLIASRLSPSGDPSKLASELAAGSVQVTAEAVTSVVNEVNTILAPLLTATGTTGSDPLTTSITTDGTGYDRLLDSLSISIVPTSSATSNVNIGIKQQQTQEDAQPTSIQFSSSTAVADISTLPTVDSMTLVESGTATLIKSLLAQLTSCYALPLASRVDTQIADGLAVGTATNVVADACKAAFFGNNPSTFLSNGTSVGRDANGKGAFGSLFKESATGAVLSQGSYEFTRQNGDIVAGYKSRDTLGNEAFDTLVLRKDTDGKLKLIGNQYTYSGGVSAYQQRRTFALDTPSDYFSTGYDLKVPLIDGVAYVKVTTPKGSVLTLIRGSDGMVLPKINELRQPVKLNGDVATSISTMVPSGTSYIRVRSEYVDATSTAAHPSTRDTGLFFTPNDATDAEISSYGNQSVWVFKYFDNTNVELATQSYKTRSRANTIAELRTRTWATLDSAGLNFLNTNFVANTATPPANNSYTKLPTDSFANIGWGVPDGALPPTQVRLFGKTGPNPKVNFNDGQSVSSTQRTTSIACVNGNGETHCGSAGYTAGTIMTGLHLWSREPSGREYAHLYAGYKLN